MPEKYQTRILYALLPCLLLIGCAAHDAGGRAAIPRQPGSTPEQPALVTKPLPGQGSPETMVELYPDSAKPESFDPNWQRLRFIDSLLQSGDSAAAKQEADELNPRDLTPEQEAQLSLLYAQIQLSAAEAEQAIESLKRIQPELLNQEDRIKYFQSLAFSYSLTGNLLDGAKSRIELQRLLTDGDEREKNQAAILEALCLLPDETLQTPQAGDAAGWMALAVILKEINRPDFDARIDQWRSAYPEHPADLSFLNHGQDADAMVSSVKSIALLLPKSGPFYKAGEAVRAGFLAAYNHSNSRTKPTLHFYDSEQANLPAVYRQAIAEGSEVIIGPLAKKQLQSLANTPSFDIPVLALNHIPGLQKPGLFQFGLSPLDDVGQLVRQAMSDGHRTALIMVPDNPAGERVGKYLTEDWQKLGGVVSAIQTYDPKTTDFSVPVRKLLNLDESGAPIPQNQTTAADEPNNAAPSRREADIILLSAYSAEARAINARLRFYRAGNIPVYALPNVYSGQVNMALDAGLDDIFFCDAPWLFNKAFGGVLGMDALKEVWRLFPSSYFRLIAMGIDAYFLAGRLNTLQHNEFSGATGTLSLSADGRIRRETICTAFKDGKPALSEPFIERNETSVPVSDDSGNMETDDHAAY